MKLDGSERHTLVRGGTDGFYADGKLLWVSGDGSVIAAPFDPNAGRLTGAPAPLLHAFPPEPFATFVHLAIGGSTLVYLPGTAVPMNQRRLAWLPSAGASAATKADEPGERLLPTPARFYRNLKGGPTGLLAATVLARDRSDVWIVDPQSGGLQRLTFDGFNIEPAWSNDGTWLAYSSNRAGAFNIYRRRVDGSAPAERLLTSAHHQHPSSVSPDGREMMVGDIDPNTGFDLLVLDLQTHRLRTLVRTPADEFGATWSPDGRWIVYQTDESGRDEVVVRTYPDIGGRWQLTDGGFMPFWSRDGRTVYFHRDGDLWAVTVDPAGRDLRPGVPRRVTQRGDLDLATAAPDGGVYTILEHRAKPSAPLDVHVVLGWQAELPPAR